MVRATLQIFRVRGPKAEFRHRLLEHHLARFPACRISRPACASCWNSSLLAVAEAGGLNSPAPYHVRPIVAEPMARFDRSLLNSTARHVDMNINPVNQRARILDRYFSTCLGVHRTSASSRNTRTGKVTPPPSENGEIRTSLRPRDRHRPILQRLAYHLKHMPRKLRELIQK